MADWKAGTLQYLVWTSGYAAFRAAGERIVFECERKRRQTSGERGRRTSAKWHCFFGGLGSSHLYGGLEVKERGIVKIFRV